MDLKNRLSRPVIENIQVPDRTADNPFMQFSKDIHVGDTVRIRRPPKVFTDNLGRTVWMSGVDPFELEIDTELLVSTDPYNRVDLHSSTQI